MCFFQQQKKTFSKYYFAGLFCFWCLLIFLLIFFYRWWVVFLTALTNRESNRNWFSFFSGTTLYGATLSLPRSKWADGSFYSTVWTNRWMWEWHVDRANRSNVPPTPTLQQTHFISGWNLRRMEKLVVAWLESPLSIK